MSENYIIRTFPRYFKMIVIYKKDSKCLVFRHALYKNTNRPNLHQEIRESR